MLHTPYALLLDLEKAGLSKTDIIQRTGISRATIYHLSGDATYWLNPKKKLKTTCKPNFEALKRLHEEEIGSLFTEEIEILFQDRDEFYHLNPSKALAWCLKYSIKALQAHPDYHQTTLNTCRLKWLEAEIYMDAALHKAYQAQATTLRAKAETLFEASYTLLYSLPVHEKLQAAKDRCLFKLSSNRLAIKHNFLPTEQRNSSAYLALLQQTNYIENVKKAMIFEPNTWHLPRSGLAIASLLNKPEVMLEFYEKLIALDGRFKDFTYTPPYVKSLKDDPDLNNFLFLFNQEAV